MFTTADLTQLAKACGAKPNAAIVQGIVDNQEWLEAGGIDTPGREAEFLAQACLETDYFRTLKEYGGPAYFERYEGRRDLGNVVVGDGKKFPGRGIFQITGRDNYARYGKRLGVDLLKEPELAARPDISVRTAILYWNDKGLNAYADKGDTAAISRAINRGNAKAKSPANHEADRIRIAKLAREIIDPRAHAPPERGNPAATAASAPAKAAPTLTEELPTVQPGVFWRFLSAFLRRLKGAA